MAFNDKAIIANIAVTRYNEQFGTKFNPADFDVFSIQPAYSNTHGYEIYTERNDDSLRLHLYFNIGQKDDFMPYRLENDLQDIKGELGDEVFVTIGLVDRYYIESRQALFGWIDRSFDELPILLQENGEPLLTEDDGFILLI